MLTPSAAVVGAGMAGISAAQALLAQGHEVVVLDKGRAAGGRVATKRGEFSVDHGAQFFTVRDPRFAAAVAPLQQDGTVLRWDGPFHTWSHGVCGPDPRPGTERWVGVPGMSALPRALANGLAVQTEVTVTAARESTDGWRLRTATGQELGPFRRLVLALPPSQAAALLAAEDPMGQQLAAIAMDPCLCLAVALASLPDRARGGMWITDEALAWAAHDGGKPGRSGAATYVLHSTPEFARRHWNAAPEDWGELLLAAFAEAVGVALPPVVAQVAHRWRYAQPGAGGAIAASLNAGSPNSGSPMVGNPTAGALHDSRRGLCAIGDGIAGGRVEGAWISGLGSLG